MALHNNRRNCWIAISGQVYDVTKYLQRHPGGDLLLKGAGRDATLLFTTLSKYGHRHSPGAYEALGHYHIGELIDAPSARPSPD